MKNIYKALASFQQSCPIIHKGTEGYGYSYASYDAIVKTINPIMAKCGLGFTQLIEKDEDNRNSIRTVIFHFESGETLESTISIPQNISLKGMNQFQVDGSSFTYYKRYGLSSMLGIITDKDLDACGSQIEQNGIEDARIDPNAHGEELEIQIKKAMVSISKRIEPNAPATLEDFDNLTLEALKDDFQSYKDQENDFNAKKWIDDQSKKPKKTGSVTALENTWKEAVSRGFNTPYVIGEFKRIKSDLLSRKEDN